MKKSALIVAVVSTLSLAGTATADSVLGVYAGVSSWEQEYDGTIRDLNTGGLQGEEIDFNQDLGLDDEKGNVIYVALEHGIPFLPNLRLQTSEIETEATSTLTRTINYGDRTFTASDTVRTEADLSHIDLTMYYQVLDNWLSLDLGLTVRFFDGFVSIESSTDSAREDFDAPVPLLYANARVDLPFSGAFAGINAHALGDGDNMFVDFQLTVGYEHSIGAGIELGYRSLDLDLDDIDDVEADLSIDGAFIGVFYHL